MTEEFWQTQIRGYKKYTDPDMKVAATFYSEAKNRKIFLEPPEEERSPMGQISKKPHTGCRVNFTNGILYIRNKKVLEMLMSHRGFGNANGFHVHPEDPTGFWRAQGIIQTSEVHVITDINRNVKFGDLDLSAAALSKVNPDELNKVYDLKTG
ncbi:MAG: hypothetical protein PHF37_06535 [Phycisphaerae bacterium]|nr:hypothetical protein [Phycisphaerae bacterium]